MNGTCEKALFHLTGKTGLDEVTVEQLRDLANAHPYFAPAQLLLTSRLKLSGDAAVAAQAAKTALYFTNPFWLQYQLREEEIPSIEPVPVPDKISSLLSEQLADFKKPVEADARLDIDALKEKLHTIDYFASQGIKVDLNALPQDRLTSQLRKFTDWLKHMKPAEAVSDPARENAVIRIAENSNESKEVVTETMAEVLEKQGQVEKAIQLYIKLSFLNPEKSAYFAARIQQLKGI